MHSNRELTTFVILLFLLAVVNLLEPQTASGQDFQPNLNSAQDNLQAKLDKLKDSIAGASNKNNSAIIEEKETGIFTPFSPSSIESMDSNESQTNAVNQSKITEAISVPDLNSNSTNKYEDLLLGIQFDYPSILPPPFTGVDFVSLNLRNIPNGENLPNSGFMANHPITLLTILVKNDQDDTLDSYVRSDLEAKKGGYTGYEVNLKVNKFDRNFTLSGLPAYLVDYNYLPLFDHSDNVNATSIYLKKDSRIFEIRYETSTDLYQEFFPVMSKLMKTFTLVN